MNTGISLRWFKPLIFLKNVVDLETPVEPLLISDWPTFVSVDWFGISVYHTHLYLLSIKKFLLAEIKCVIVEDIICSCYCSFDTSFSFCWLRNTYWTIGFCWLHYALFKYTQLNTEAKYTHVHFLYLSSQLKSLFGSNSFLVFYS